MGKVERVFGIIQKTITQQRKYIYLF